MAVSFEKDHYQHCVQFTSHYRQWQPTAVMILDMSETRLGNMLSPHPEVMLFKQFAAFLQVSRSSLYKLSQEGLVPGQKLRKHWRFL